MILAKKNVFGFATIAATVTLSAAIFATGCGDSGDTTAAVISPSTARNAVVLYYDNDLAKLRSNKIDTLSWIITKADGKLLAASKNPQKIVIPAEEKTSATSSTTSSTPTPTSSAKESDKCYTVLQMEQGVFDEVAKGGATVTAVYFNSTDKDNTDKILGFSSNSNINWDSKNKNGTADANFFLDEKGVQYIMGTTPDVPVIAKGGTVRLSCKVRSKDYAKDKKEADIIRFVKVDAGNYLKADDSSNVVGQYKGVEYTKEEGTEVKATLKNASEEKVSPTTIYVTDKKITGFTIENSYAGVLAPTKTDLDTKTTPATPALDYSFGMSEVQGIPAGTPPSSKPETKTYGVRQAAMKVTKITWGGTGGEEPKLDATSITGVKYEVTKVDSAAVKAEDAAKYEVKDNVVKFGLNEAAGKTFTVTGTLGKSALTGDKDVTATAEVKPSGADVNVGLNTAENVAKKTTHFTTEVSADKDTATGKIKETEKKLKMYAQFVETGVTGGLESYLFEIPEAASFTYPKLAHLYDASNVLFEEKFTSGDFDKKYKAEIAGANEQGLNNYAVIVREAGLNLKVGFAKSDKDTTRADDADQIKAFGNYKDLNIDAIIKNLIIAK